VVLVVCMICLYNSCLLEIWIVGTWYLVDIMVFLKWGVISIFFCMHVFVFVFVHWALVLTFLFEGVVLGLSVYVVYVSKCVLRMSWNLVLKSVLMNSWSLWCMHSMYVASGFVYCSFGLSGFHRLRYLVGGMLWHVY
jgi:hypothetical protein